MADTPILLFVYGTLRRGCSSGAHHRYLVSASLVATGRVRGKLYRLETYPGLVPDGEHWVHGEVYQLPDLQALASMDEYEGCAGRYLEPREYRREKITVELPDGGSLETWCYYYNWRTDSLGLIQSGDFLNP
jgi:gamma-glutamylcyclotransferase (GGCT)/AIG2-like uncharacterized protein YtfP